MKLSLLAVGRLKDKHAAALASDYSGRISRYAPWDLIEVKDARGDGAERSLEVEGRRLIDKLAPSLLAVSLDEHGATYTSVEFADWLDSRRQQGREVRFVLGGPWGLSDEVKARCEESIRLSHMTLPHELARVLFLEQLYRAFTIQRGSKYHHD